MNAPAEPAVCIVLHDAAPSTRAAGARTLAAIREVAGESPVTILAVPRYHGETPTPEFEGWLDERVGRGDELALHGCTHRDDGAPQGWLDGLRRSRYTRGEGEFWALSKADALARIDVGIDWFGRHRWPLAGFVAPAWLLGTAAREAVAERPFDYTATLRQLVHLPAQTAVTSQSVVYSTSSAWRRGTSLVWNAAVDLAQRGNPLLRIELHPRDADFAPVKRSWQRILERALRSRTPLTVAEFMRRTRPALPLASAPTAAARGD
jgi:predicted deacetylase